MPRKKTPTSFYLSPKAHAILKAIEAQRGLSRVASIEAGLSLLAEALKVKVDVAEKQHDPPPEKNSEGGLVT